MISPFRVYGIGCTLFFVIGLSHLIGHFLPIPLKNYTEIQLKVLMDTYPKKIAGGSMTMMDIQDGLSLCYSLFFIFSGVVNFIVLKRDPVDSRLLQRLSFVNAVAFGAAFLIALRYFFWLPVISCLSVAVTFFIAWGFFVRSDRLIKKI